MNNPSDDTIGTILRTIRTVAVVGWSPKPDRPSNRVAAFLSSRGMKVLRVNPGPAGQLVEGSPVYAHLAEIPNTTGVEMVDIFRRSEAVPEIVDAALEHLPDLKVIWMQLGVVNEPAAEKARARGIIVVQDRCPLIESARMLIS